MSLSNWLGIIAIIIGLPSFLAAFSLEGYRGYSILAITIAAILGLFWWILRMPSWTIIEMHWTLKILTTDGKSVAFTSEAKVRANQKGLTEYSHRRISADGSIRNFRLFSTPINKNDIQKIAGEYIVYDRFNSMRRWQKRNLCLSYDLIDSFTKSTESITCVPDYFTREFRIDLYFPIGRIPRNVKAYRGLGAEIHELTTPNCSPDGQKVTWEGHKLKPGQYYTIEWDW